MSVCRDRALAQDARGTAASEQSTTVDGVPPRTGPSSRISVEDVAEGLRDELSASVASGWPETFAEHAAIGPRRRASARGTS